MKDATLVQIVVVPIIAVEAVQQIRDAPITVVSNDFVIYGKIKTTACRCNVQVLP
jgi:hypothetical protein